MIDQIKQEKQIQELITSLKSIDRACKIAFMDRDVDPVVVRAGTIAENAILKIEPDYDYKPQ